MRWSRHVAPLGRPRAESGAFRSHRPMQVSGRAAAAMVAIAAIMHCGCSANHRLTVDLHTDLVPEIEMYFVRIELFEGTISTDEAPLQSVSAYPCCLYAPASSEAGAFRLASFPNLPAGAYTVRVVAHRPTSAGVRPEDGAVLGRRSVLSSIAADRVVPVVLTSACAHVSCPGAGDPTTNSECFNGRCVPPECDPTDPAARAFCGTALCRSASDCAAPACATAECLGGLCVASDRVDGCSDGYYCDRTAGACLRGSGPLPDAGLPDASCPAEQCTSGLDEDCDGQIDCADADCAGVSCDDGNACTHGDACTGVASAPCAGVALDCASDACMERSCNGGATCTELPRDGACEDDGDPCTQDVCSAGACAHMPVPDNTPCPGAGSRCCAGTCVDTTSNPAHCGVCGITCPGSCSLGACACTSNVQCQAAGYGASATCATDSRPNFCQCVCNPGDTSWRGECDECPGAARCAQVSGLNPCIFP